MALKQSDLGKHGDAASVAAEDLASGRGRLRVMQGVVRRAAIDKTAVVEVSQKVMHRVYKKFVRRRRRYLIHDAENTCGVGDVVRIRATRPLSRKKRWALQQVVERAK